MPESNLIPRVKALIGFRAVFITFLLGSIFVFKIEYLTLPYPHAITYFIISMYALTVVYAVLLPRIKNLFRFVYVQIIFDVIAEIALIYLTGGIESWFSFILLLTVLSSSIVLNKKAGYIIASFSSILYGLLIDLQFYRLLPIGYTVSIREQEFLYNIFIHILSFYITAYLGGYLSHRLEKTVRKLEEQNLYVKDLELFNTTVIESLPGGLFVTDIDNNVTIFNKAAEKIVGIKKNDVLGKKIESVLPFLKYPLQVGRFEKTLLTGQNEKKIIGMTISVFEDMRGTEAGYIGVFQNLTQFKKLEAEIKQKEQWATIGELSANIAHEIRNPLASLKGSIEILKENKSPSIHRDKLMGIALKEMDRLNLIITDFLTYSSPKQISLQKTDIHSLLDETMELIRNIEDYRDNISVKKEFKGLLYAYVDPQKIRQVFWNLGMNAIEAMTKGGELVVGSYDNADTIRLTFTDNGPGISAADINKIFYPFFTTKEEGTGLGLSIAYRIIEEHRGTLSVQSVPDIKTCFEIALPKNNE
jgi:two-component system sensor histidine kinase PilS (NtrC family)